MKKVADKLIDLFMWIWGLIVYSLIIPIVLALIAAFETPIENFLNLPYSIKIPIFVLLGFVLMKRRENKLNSARKGSN